jgi:hypothetical protein
VQIIEVVNIEDDTRPFPKIEHEENKIDHTTDHRRNGTLRKF